MNRRLTFNASNEASWNNRADGLEECTEYTYGISHYKIWYCLPWIYILNKSLSDYPSYGFEYGTITPNFRFIYTNTSDTMNNDLGGIQASSNLYTASDISYRILYFFTMFYTHLIYITHIHITLYLII